MSERDWDAIYSVLVKEAGALERERAQFVAQFEALPRPREWRFCGLLGFGGKVWDNGHGPIYVNCYREDETPARLKIIEFTNAALRSIAGDAERGADTK